MYARKFDWITYILIRNEFFVFSLLLCVVLGERASSGLHTFISTFIDSIHFVISSRRTEVVHLSPLMRGVLLQIAVLALLVVLLHLFRKSKFGIAFSLLFENMYEFFEEILGKEQKKTFKIYVVTLFFIILISNLLSYTLDLIRVVFVDIEALPKYITIPTTSFTFNLALAGVSILIMLYIQFRRTGFLKFILEYLPITGKGILDVEKGSLPPFFYYPVKGIVKVFDIAISLFVGVLDIIGIGAKAISLTARLYGNMLAGGILLGLLVAGVNMLFHSVFADGFPLIGPIILYAQGLLVALIQAFVFPLLVAIFIKIAQEG